MGGPFHRIDDRRNAAIALGRRLVIAIRLSSVDGGWGRRHLGGLPDRSIAVIAVAYFTNSTGHGDRIATA